MSCDGQQKFDLRDELDASVECGSGYICLFGPPGSGKTTLLLRYLAAREQHVCNMGGLFHLEYVTGRAVDGDPLQRLTWRLQPRTKRRRADCTILQFGCVVRQWLDAAVKRSELHFVVDDADALEDDAADINQWLSGCMTTSSGRSGQSTVFLWLVSQMPLHLSNCFRFHFMSSPEGDVVKKWLDDLFAVNRTFALNEPGPEVPHLTPEQTHTAVTDAVAHYTSHLPMRGSVVARDIRLLLPRVYDLLPLLLSRRERGHPNAMDYSAAWGRQRAAGGAGPPCKDGGGDLLVAALRRIGCSAMLWAVSAFYCGAVPKSRQAHVIDGETLRQRTSLREKNATSHKGAVLSSSAHVVRVSRLMVVYNALLKICVNHIDPLEFSSAETAVQHNQTLLSWGLLVPSLRNPREYRCHIPVTSAVGLAKLLSLSLYDLIPQ